MIRIVSTAVLALGFLLIGLSGPAGDNRQGSEVTAFFQAADAPLLLAGEFPWQRGH